MTAKPRKAAVAALLVACAIAPRTNAGVLKDGDTVALVGDSITEGRNYTSLIEDYLLACQPRKLHVIEYGWGGEQAIDLLGRYPDVLANRPTVVTLCYGMNDGHYTTISDATRSTFKECLTRVVDKFKNAGATVIVGSPGCVDTTTFHGRPVSAEEYDKTLAALRDEARGVAFVTNCTFADLFDPMTAAMKAGKAKFGDKYSIAGTDGVHPNLNGGLPMAYAFLKALGCDGEIGSIHADLNAHSATTTGPHQCRNVFAAGDDKGGMAFTVESSRYPFCFWGDPADQASTTGLLDALAFNADLNRFMLYADGPAAKYKVTWGKASKEFTNQQLHDGINLAAEFLDNPFVEPFKQLHQAVMRKEQMDTQLFKGVLHNDAGLRPQLPEAANELTALDNKAIEAGRRFADEAAAMVKPVTYDILFEPVN